MAKFILLSLFILVTMHWDLIDAKPSEIIPSSNSTSLSNEFKWNVNDYTALNSLFYGVFFFTIPILPILNLDQVGIIALPLNIGCRSKLSRYATCLVCSLDCIYVHNTYSGNCGLTPENRYTCFCNKKNNNGNKKIDALAVTMATCGRLTEAGADEIERGALTILAFVIRARMKLLQCSVGNAGCVSDCYHNHSENNGKCEKNAVAVYYPTFYPDNKTYCLCSNPIYNQ